MIQLYTKIFGFLILHIFIAAAFKQDPYLALQFAKGSDVWLCKIKCTEFKFIISTKNNEYRYGYSQNYLIMQTQFLINATNINIM